MYERLVRHPERPDPAAWRELHRRVEGWARLPASGVHRDAVGEAVAETCAEVWRTLQLARGGPTFEGFAQGRFVEVARRLAGAGSRPALVPVPVPGAARSGRAGEPAGASAPDVEAARLARLGTALDGLRRRNPLHHRAVALVYQDRATVDEAADALAVDGWVVRALLARARQALAQEVDRSAPTRTTGRRSGRADDPAGRARDVRRTSRGGPDDGRPRADGPPAGGSAGRRGGGSGGGSGRPTGQQGRRKKGRPPGPARGGRPG